MDLNSLKKIRDKVRCVVKHYSECYAQKDLINKVRPYTLVEDDRLLNIHKLAKMALASVPGDFLECGVFNGGSAAVIADAIKGALDRRLWLYDTFSGIPAPTSEDGVDAVKFTGSWAGSMDKVDEVLAKVNFPKRNTVTKQGVFERTLVETPERIALVHIDADWCESVTVCLENLYPKVSEGGVVILDDFGYWEGCRKAFYSYCKKSNIAPVLNRVGNTQAWWIKGKVHNQAGMYRIDPMREF